jgi:uncharacterized membrane protein YphA (DoxX/SURF4 family)
MKAASAHERWGRAAMASFFVVGAAMSIAAHEPSWQRVVTGDSNPLDWVYALTALAGLLSGAAFVLGRAPVAIALGWTAYCVVNAFAAYPFWAVTGTAVADDATGFLSHLAVAASLMLYVSRAEARA